MQNRRALLGYGLLLAALLAPRRALSSAGSLTGTTKIADPDGFCSFCGEYVRSPCQQPQDAESCPSFQGG